MASAALHHTAAILLFCRNKAQTASQIEQLAHENYCPSQCIVAGHRVLHNMEASRSRSAHFGSETYVQTRPRPLCAMDGEASFPTFKCNI